MLSKTDLQIIFSNNECTLTISYKYPGCILDINRIAFGMCIQVDLIGMSKKHSIEHAVVDFEQAITLTGFGKFHYSIILVCGLIFASAGFQNGMNAYIMPAAECDLQMSSNEKGLLNAVFLGGGLASAFFWGILADHMGRKKVLVFCLLLDGIVTLASSFSQTFIIFALFRFCNGFLTGGPGSVVIPYLGEFLGNKHRASSLCFVGFFWTISWMILPAVALGVMPITWSYETAGFLYNSWRIYVVLFSFPAIIAGIILASTFPESPKFLFSQGREMESLDILRYIFYQNNGQRLGEYPVKTIISDEMEGRQPSIIPNSLEASTKMIKNSGKSFIFILKGITDQARTLFSFPIVSSTSLAATLMFANMFGYYGLGLWLPELFSRFEDHYKTSNVSVTVCEVSSVKSNKSIPRYFSNEFENESSVAFPINIEDDCSDNDINPTVFINTFIIGASCLVGNLMSSVLAKRVGLRNLAIITMFVSGVCATAIYFLKNSTQILLVSCVFLTFMGNGNMIISSAIVDLFPTKVRALAVCTAIFAGRMGAVASNLTLGYTLDISCEVPIFLMSSVALAGSLTAFLLPREQTTKL